MSLPRYTQIYPTKLVRKILQGFSKANVIREGGEEAVVHAVEDEDEDGGKEIPRRPQSFQAALRRLH
eukprot:2596929-Pyramimonas_sp.AAC.1